MKYAGVRGRRPGFWSPVFGITDYVPSSNHLPSLNVVVYPVQINNSKNYYGIMSICHMTSTVPTALHDYLM